MPTAFEGGGMAAALASPNPVEKSKRIPAIKVFTSVTRQHRSEPSWLF